MKKTIFISVVFIFFAFRADYCKNEYTVPVFPRSVFISDINMDDNPDIIIGHGRCWGETNKSISILTNNQDGYFSISDTSKSFCGHQDNIFAVKIDNDDYPDLVTFYSDYSTGVMDRYIRIFYNENGEFNQFSDFSLNSSETFTTINHGDINGDGFIDLVVVSNLARIFGVLYNDGYGNFSPPEYYNISFSPLDIITADLNNDGRDDIIIGGFVEILFSKPEGFQSFSTNVYLNRLKVADLDKDGDMDIIGNYDLSPPLHHTRQIIENIGNEDFLIHAPTHFKPLCSFQFVTSDFNNDSLPDLLFHTKDMNNLALIYNKGDLNFSDPEYIPINNYGESEHQSASDDLDGNGYNDIVTIRGWGAPLPANVNIFFNDGNGNFVDSPLTAIDEDEAGNTATEINCYPNPLKDKLYIEFEVLKTTSVKIFIFNMNGKVIKTLTNKNYQSGKYSIVWNTKDINGKEVKEGLYVIHLQLGDKSISKRVVLTK